MKIAIDVRVLMSDQLTGVGIYTKELLKRLFELDKINQYKLFYNSSSFKNSEILSGFNKYENVQLAGYKYPNKLFNAASVFFNKPKFDELLGQPSSSARCDLFWFPNLNFWSLSDKCKSIVTVHDLSFEKIPWAYSKKMRLWHRFIKPRQKLEQADKIVAVSESTKRDLVNLYNLAEDKIEMVYSGVNEGQGASNKEQVREKYKLPEKYILYLGTLEPRKNVEGIIQAFELLNDTECHLIIAGGKGWLYKNIYELANQSKLKDRIKFIDYVNPDDRFALYESAELFVWPSFYEGFGFPPLEAMSVGCPVITSSNSSLPEVVQNSALLVDPYNIKEISQAMSQILNDSELRQSLINKGYEQVKKFDWQRSAEKMLEIFNSFDYDTK